MTNRRTYYKIAAFMAGIVAGFPVWQTAEAISPYPVTEQSRLWPNATIPFHISPDFTAVQALRITLSAEKWSQAGITFERLSRKPDQGPVLLIVPSAGRCSAHVGIGDDDNLIRTMTLTPLCISGHEVDHEFGHVLHLQHTPNAEDRWQWIESMDCDVLAWRDIRRCERGQSSMFRLSIEPIDAAQSTMLPGTRIFSESGPTYYLHPGLPLPPWGRVRPVSDADIAVVRDLYAQARELGEDAITEIIDDSKAPIEEYVRQEAGVLTLSIPGDQELAGAATGGLVENPETYVYEPLSNLPGWDHDSQRWAFSVPVQFAKAVVGRGLFLHWQGESTRSIYFRVVSGELLAQEMVL